MTEMEESAAIEELQGLSEEAKGWLAHHIRNELQKVLLHEFKHAEDAVHHIARDLRKIGC